MTTTELSTTMPKSMAPRLSSVPAMPIWYMPLKANSMHSGIPAAAINPARRLPRKMNKITTTSSAPSQRLLRTVAITSSTSSVRS